jgi:hypothetical protein
MEIEWEKLFSHRVMVPVQAHKPFGESGRIVIDWRGIPLAVPYRFDEIPPGHKIRIVKLWQERGNFFLKLAHPGKGTTVDYTIRCLFNPEKDGFATQRVFAFLEMAPGCPGGGETVPVWTVVERLDATTILTLYPDEMLEQKMIIAEIIQNHLAAPLEAIEAAFGVMPTWENPDWGDEGNIYLVCVQCFRPLSEQGQTCSH